MHGPWDGQRVNGDNRVGLTVVPDNDASGIKRVFIWHRAGGQAQPCLHAIASHVRVQVEAWGNCCFGGGDCEAHAIHTPLRASNIRERRHLHFMLTPRVNNPQLPFYAIASCLWVISARTPYAASTTR